MQVVCNETYKKCIGCRTDRRKDERVLPFGGCAQPRQLLRKSGGVRNKFCQCLCDGTPSVSPRRFIVNVTRWNN